MEGLTNSLCYQLKREPLTQYEVNRLANACDDYREKLIIWTLLDTGPTCFGVGRTQEG
jgi:hypothetical protein